MPSTPPKRACLLELSLGADTQNDIINALNHLIFLIRTKSLTTGCSGGYGSGYTYTYSESEHPTHDEFVAELERYLAQERGEE